MRDWPYVKMAVRELWPVAVLGLAGAVGVLTFVNLDAATLSFCVLALASLWGGTIVGGGTTRKMLHLLVRPIARDRLLAIRVAVLVGLLGLVVLGFVLAGRHAGEMYPVWGIFVGVCVCAFAGVITGAATESETSALGIGLLAASVVLVPPILFASGLDLTWNRVENGLGWLQWPFAIGLVACAVLPMRHAWRTVPHRSNAWRLRLGVHGLLVAVLQFTLGWAPAFLIAAGPLAGEPIGAFRGPVGSYLLATGSRYDASSDAIADGLVLVEGDTRREIFDASILHSLTGGQSGTIESVEASPNADHLAIVLRQTDVERRVLVVRTSTGEASDLGGKLVPTIVWSVDGTHLLVEGAEVEVYRVGEAVHLVSVHKSDRVWPSLENGRHDELAAWAGEVVGRSDAPLDLGGGWVGGRPVWLVYDDSLLVESFDPRDRSLHTAPIDLQLESPSIYRIASPDGAYLAFAASGRRRGVHVHSQIYIIDRDGSVVVQAPLEGEWRVRRIYGPPRGPWLTQDVMGTITARTVDAGYLWYERLAPIGRLADVPIAIGDHTVVGIGPDGEPWEHTVPWIGGAR